MRERRRYTGEERRGRVLYGLEELKGLVGGQRSQTASRDLSADVKRLGELGLVVITKQSISFAETIEQIRTEAPLDEFWAFFQALPNRRRSVPVPRRTLRALAAGFGRAETAYIIAALMRSVFWSKKTGKVTTDGRLKLSTVSKTFGISRRAATNARARLIELGWLRPIETQTWERNRWGVRDVVQVDWTAPKKADATAEIVDNPAVGEGGGSGESASPSAGLSAKNASPLNRSSLSARDLRTRRLGAAAPTPAGVSPKKREQREASRGRQRAKRSISKPNIRDIRAENLNDPGALTELRRQAIALGFAFEGESGELDFFALANRARARGSNPSALFFDLISKHRTAFITISDEEAARAQLREYREGPTWRSGGGEGKGPASQRSRALTEEEHVVETCIRAAKQHRIEDPFRIACKVKSWTRPQWDDAYLRYRTTQMRQWQPADGEELAAVFA